MSHGDCVTRFLNILPFMTRDHEQGSNIGPQHNLSFENPMGLSLETSVDLKECSNLRRCVDDYDWGSLNWRGFWPVYIEKDARIMTQ